MVRKILIVALGLLLMLIPLTGCATEVAKKLVFADLGFDSAQVNNRIAGFILEHGYGYQIEYLPGETIKRITI